MSALPTPIMVAIRSSSARSVGPCTRVTPGGLSALTTLPLGLRSLVRLEVRVQGTGRRFINLKGRVSATAPVHGDTIEVGVTFVDPDPVALQELLAAAAQHSLLETPAEPSVSKTPATVAASLLRQVEAFVLSFQDFEACRPVADRLVRTGALFIPVEDGPPLNSAVVLLFQIGASVVPLQGRVVHVTSGATHPAGVGVAVEASRLALEMLQEAI